VCVFVSFKPVFGSGPTVEVAKEGDQMNAVAHSKGAVEVTDKPGKIRPA
jgi:hypothetical protein